MTSGPEPVELPIQHFAGRDGIQLAYRELGEGRPVVLIHGFFSTAVVNWIRFGHAARLAETGHRVIMPDLRGHGASAKPHDATAYPPDVLTDDGFALLDHLGLGEADYQLGGYSLGARTVLRMLVRGARPERALIGGMGLNGMVETGPSVEYYRHVLENFGTFRHGDPEFMAQAFLKTVGGDPVALLRVIESSVDTTREEIAAIEVPSLVVMGDLDEDHGSGPELATLLDGVYREVPGSHMGAVARPELGEALAGFLV